MRNQGRSFALLGLVGTLSVGACGTTVGLGPACGDEDQLCDGRCVDVESDHANCGSCGVECPAESACVGGACSTPGCSEGVPCGGVCTDVSSDPVNCGGCGVVCVADTVCVGGLCQGACPGGLLLCGDLCTDVGSDPFNCGDCFVPCGPGQVCTFGACQCPGPGLIDCAGICVDPLSDIQNCGGCFNPCPPDTKCVSGFCQDPCSMGQTFCGGLCVDTFSDPGNCGGCFFPCPNGQACLGGFCGCGDACGACGVVDLGSTVPQSVSGSTMGLFDALGGSCGGFGSPDSVFSFTAPFDGTYTFDTFGTPYDSVLYVLDASCFEIGCNDDDQVLAAHLTIGLLAGQTVYLVVDGAGGSQGNFVLNLEQTSLCPSADLGSMVPQTVYGSTIGGASSLDPSCGPSGNPDVTFQFTAPAAASYSFDTFGSNYDTVLHVRDATCAGPELGCNDDALGIASQLSLPLAAGQVVVVVVDGFGSGDFVLTIQ